MERKIVIFFCSILLIAISYFSICACQAASHLIINEIQITGGAGKTSRDFIELYNPTSSKINLKGYRLVKRTKTGTTDTSIKSWTSDAYIQSKGYYLWANSENGWADSLLVDAATTQTISEDNGVALRNGVENSGTIIDSVGWGACQNTFIETLPFSQNPGANQSLERNHFSDTDSNAIDFILENSPSPTASEPDESDEPEPVPDEHSIRLNEIYPYPDTAPGEKEFVEIVNAGKDSESLSGCWIEDGAKHKTDLPNKILGPQEIYFSEGNFYLNNDEDSVYLFCPGSGTAVDFASYEKAKEKYSYSFDGSKWRWTKTATPGAVNKFDEAAEDGGVTINIKKENHIYVNVYAYFTPDDKENETKKYTWDFGDGHHSYIRDTKHKYDKTGTYSASLIIKDGGQEDTKNFTIIVEDYPHPKVRITAVSANPVGKDAEGEAITVANKSKSKINLNGWSVATGSKKKLTNHPIKDDLVIKPDHEKDVTRDICSFALSNTKATIELRYPDGETAHKIKYNRQDDPIEEGEVYQKVKGGWDWRKARINTDVRRMDTDDVGQGVQNDESVQNVESEKADINLNELNKITQEEIDTAIGKTSEEYEKPKIILASYEYALPKNTSMVLGVSDAKLKNIPSETPKENKFSLKEWAKRANLFLSRLVGEII